MDLTLVKDLNPCSKCGSAPEFIIERDSIGGINYLKVHCKSCNSDMVIFPMHIIGPHVDDDIRTLVNDWNKNNPIQFRYTIPKLYPRTMFANDLINNTKKKEYETMFRGNFGYGMTSYYGVDRKFAIDKVIFNDPATIVFWKDGTKTVVKAANEPFDPEKGLAMAISKKALGNQGNYFNVFKKYIITEEEMAEAEADAMCSPTEEAVEAFTEFGNAVKEGLKDE